MNKIMVVAPEAAYMKNWAKYSNIPESRLLHISSFEKIKGLPKESRFVWVDSPRKESEKIITELAQINAVELSIDVNAWPISEFPRA